MQNKSLFGLSFTRFSLGAFCFLILIFSPSASAQIYNWEWAKKISGSKGENASCIALDKNGNLFLAGNFTSDTLFFDNKQAIKSNVSLWGGLQNIFLLKYDSTGQVLWCKTWSATEDVICSKIITDNSGNIYMTGCFYSNILILGSDTLKNASGFNRKADIFITKIDPSGKVVWAKAGNGAYSNDFARDIDTDSKGNIYITGDMLSTKVTFDAVTLQNGAAWGSDIYIASYDPNGKLRWAKSFPTVDAELGEDIEIDKDDNIVLSGSFISNTIKFGTVTINKTYINSIAEGVVVKFDSNGNALWGKSFGGPGSSNADGLAIDDHGNIFMVGNYKGPSTTIDSVKFTNLYSNYNNALIAKYNANGKLIWANSFGGEYEDYAYDIEIYKNSNVYITGDFTSTKLKIGSIELINSSVNSKETYIAKFDNCGKTLWAQTLNGTGEDGGIDIISNSKGDAFITGYFTYPSISFGSKTLSTNSNNGNFDSYFTKFNDNLNTLFPVASYTYTSNNLKVNFSDRSKNVKNYYWDFGDGQVSVDPNPEHIYSATGTYMVCETVGDACDKNSDCKIVTVGFAALPELKSSSSVKIYPNPFADKCFVSIQNSAAFKVNTQFTISDTYGREIYTTFLKQSTETIEPLLSPGVYFWKVYFDKSRSESGKIIIQ